jgi:hypothetical protein
VRRGEETNLSDKPTKKSKKSDFAPKHVAQLSLWLSSTMRATASYYSSVFSRRVFETQSRSAAGGSKRFFFLVLFLLVPLSLISYSIASSEYVDMRCVAGCESTISSDTKNNSEKKFQLAIMGIFKNEGDILKEWLDHHLWQGVEHFYLVDNNSNDHVMSILEPYISKGLITLHHSAAIHAQKALMNAMLRDIVVKEAEFVLSIDLDEFAWARPKGMGGSSGDAVVANTDDATGVSVFNIATVLRDERMAKANAIYMGWSMYGSSGLEKQPKR